VVIEGRLVVRSWDEYQLPAISRRALLGAALLWPAGSAARADEAAAAHSPRIAALDWGWAETLVALGRPPVAIVERAGYSNLVVEPVLPEGVFDLGVHTEPSLERLHRLRPDLIVSTPALESVRHLVETIAPVVSLPIYPAPGGAYRRACSQTLELAKIIHCEEAARAMLDEAAQLLRGFRERLGAPDHPFYIVRIVDARHGVVYGKGSLFQDILDELGLVNAWQGTTNAYGTRSIGLEQLIDVPDARLIAIRTGNGDMVRPSGPLWEALPSVRERRVVTLPPIWGFGAVPSALRFARLLVAGVTEQRNG
jgi:ferric hydroxamate transport system substrate-binding protein